MKHKSGGALQHGSKNIISWSQTLGWGDQMAGQYFKQLVGWWSW